jgi:hypothetical protein
MSAEGMQTTLIATSIFNAMAEDKLQGHDLTIGVFGAAMSNLIRELANATLYTAPTTGSAPGAIYQEQDGAGHWIDIPRIRYNMIPNPLWKRIVMSDHLYSAFTDLEIAYKAGLAAAPASPAASALTDEQILAIWRKFAETGLCSDVLGLSRALLAASMGGEPT